MKNDLNKNIQRISKNKRRKKLIHNILMAVASLMVFVTVYVLILPAITAEKENMDASQVTIDVADVSVQDSSDSSSESSDGDSSAEGSEQSAAEDSSEDSADEASSSAEENQNTASEEDGTTETEDGATDSESTVFDEGSEDDANVEESTEGKQTESAEEGSSEEDSESTNYNAVDENTNAELNEEELVEEQAVEGELIAETQEPQHDAQNDVEFIKSALAAIEEQLADDTLSEENIAELQAKKEALEAQLAEKQKLEEALQLAEWEKGLTPLTEEEIAAFSKDEIDTLEKQRELETEFYVSNFAMTRSSEPSQKLVTGKIKVKLPLGVNASRLTMKAEQIDLTSYKIENRSIVFGYDIKLYTEDISGNEVRYTLPYGQAQFTIYDRNINVEKEEEYSLLKMLNINDYKSLEFEVHETDQSTESGKPYGKVMFKNKDFGIFALYEDETDVDIDKITNVKAFIEFLNLLPEQQEELKDVKIEIQETEHVKNTYELTRRVVENNKVIDKEETLSKIFAYDLHLSKNGMIYPINQDGNNPILMHVRLEHKGIKKADKDYYQVYYVKNGELTKDNKMKIVEVEDGSVSFETDHFSDYALFKSNLENETEEDFEIDVEEGEILNTETFEVLLESKRKEAEKNNETVVNFELGNTVEIDDAYVLSNELVNGLKLNIIRKDGFVHQLFEVKEGASLRIKDTVISGSAPNVKANAPLIVNNGNLVIENGTVLKDNYNEGTWRDRGNSRVPYITFGGAVWSDGNIDIHGGEITNCKAGFGGGIYIHSQSAKWIHLNLTDGLISNNHAILYGRRYNQIYEANEWSQKKRLIDIYNPRTYEVAGGGIYLGDYVNMSMSGGTISNNSASKEGGGIAMKDLSNVGGNYGHTNTGDYLGTFYMTGGSFSGNSAEFCGGALTINSSRLAEIYGGSFTENHTEGRDPIYRKNRPLGPGSNQFSGGAIYIHQKVRENGIIGKPGTLKMENVLIKNNSANTGGGIAACPNADTRINIKNGTVIYGNSGAEMFFSNEGQKDVASSMINGLPYSWNIRSKSLDNIYLISGRRGLAYYNSWDSSDNEIKEIENSNLISVRFIANYTESGYGGAIGANGDLIIGQKTEENEVKKSVSVKKIWKDGDAEDRPKEIRVSLKMNGREIDSQILNSGNDWYFEWANLQDGDYSVEEEKVEDYETEVKALGRTINQVKQFKNGFSYLITWNKYPLINSTEKMPWDVFFDEDLDYESDPKSSIKWKANTKNDGFTLTNEETGYKLSLYSASDNRYQGFYAASAGASNDEIKLLPDTKGEYSALASQDSNGWVFANINRKKTSAMKNGKNDGYYIPVISSSSNVSGLEVYKVIDQAFEITNTKVNLKTYSLQLNKIDGENGKKLEGAEFSLTKEGDTVKEELKTNEEGFVVIDNIIPKAVYFLEETKAPNNYEKLGKKIVFSIDDDGKFIALDKKAYPETDFIHVSLDIDANNSEDLVYGIYNDSAHLYVKNKTIGYILPETGGVGTGVYTLLGIIMMATSIAIIAIRKMVKRKRRA